MLELAIAHELYARYPDFSEGRLAKIRSHVVSRASCAVVARELDLGRRLGEQSSTLQPEEIERLAKNRNVLAALLEAVPPELLTAVFTTISFRTTSQLSIEVRPVLRPPETFSRAIRARTLMSTPFQWEYSLPILSARV